MYKYISLIIINLFFFWNINSQEVIEYKNGDLIFQAGKGSDFENAITDVTTGLDNINISHVGVIYFENDSIFVLEASTEKGVAKTIINDFIKNSSVIIVGRLKPEYQYSITNAINVIKSLIGKPYDYVFGNDNDAYYCSELIQIAFKEKNGDPIFETIPMTFKDNSTGETLPYWIDYYKNYNLPIPEGEPGTNPGQLSKSDKIEIIYTIFIR